MNNTGAVVAVAASLAALVAGPDGPFVEAALGASKVGALAYVSVMVRRNTDELREMRKVLFSSSSTKGPADENPA